MHPTEKNFVHYFRLFFVNEHRILLNILLTNSVLSFFTLIRHFCSTDVELPTTIYQLLTTVTMQIQTQKGNFELPVDFKIEITRYSQVLNNIGSQSSAITLPATPHNLMLVEHIDKPDAFYKPIKQLPVIVSSGSYTSFCELYIHNANSEGIVCTLYFDKALFASLIEKKKLRDISFPEFSVGDGTWTKEQRVNYLINLLKNQYDLGLAEVPFEVFPVMTDEKVNEFKYISQGVYEDTFKENNFILNGFYSTQTNETEVGDVFLNIFTGEFPRKFKQGDGVIDADKGYGMTPFLKLDFVLTQLFQHFGYTFNDNEFMNTIRVPKSFVILNNVVDAIYAGTLNYKQLLPDIEIKDFLVQMEHIFAGKFIINEFEKTVNFKRYNEISNLHRKDITTYISINPQMQEAEFHTMKLRNIADKKFKEESGVEYLDYYSPLSEYILLKFNTEVADRYIEDNQKHTLLDEITHANSDVIIEGEMEEQKENQKDSVALSSAYLQRYEVFEFNDDGTIYGQRYVVRRCDDPIKNEALEDAYVVYFDFLKDSNIPVKCDCNLPTLELMQLNTESIVLINGVQFLIESITYALPFDGKQKLTLRTFHPFADRE